MREDHIEFGLDSTANSYYTVVGSEGEGSFKTPVFGPDMAAVRRARHGLNRRHFPNNSDAFNKRNGIVPLRDQLDATIKRGQSALERARDRFLYLYDIDASPATLAAARGEVLRIAAKLEDIQSKADERAARKAKADDPNIKAQVLARYKQERSALSIHIKAAKGQPELVASLQDQRMMLSRKINALEGQIPKGAHKPSSNRPERSHLADQKMIVGSFSDINESEPVGFAIFEEQVRNDRGGWSTQWWTTQFVYRNVLVRNDAEVHKLNRSYLMDGVPMEHAPDGGTYRVMEPAESYRGPFFSFEDAEQDATNWKSECRDIYNDSDRILGWDTAPDNGRTPFDIEQLSFDHDYKRASRTPKQQFAE